MLVLSRNIGEEIVIAGHIRVRVVGMEGHSVRLGVSAPREILVDRKEVFERRQVSRAAPAPYWNAEALGSAQLP